MSVPELLSPAGQWDSLVAAVQNGADAVYLGGKTLNARRGAGNFDSDELKRASDYLHERGKKLYVTVNTLVKQSELKELERMAEDLAACRADAAIVQDAGVCRVLSQMVPGLRLHASTQMAVSSAQGAEYLKKRGFERAVLAREMDLDEIRKSAETGIEIEVFCHGALCVACSGLCLFSSLVGGRSGNRGACAQPCRMEYTLSGARQASGYLLSPKDLMSAGFLEKLTGAGVKSLKIEGRLKRPEYVAVVTGIYRRLLDGDAFTPEDEEKLRQIFNRGGFTRGYAEGIRDGEFLSVRRPSHWGVGVGRAVSAREIRLAKDVLNADTLVVRPEKGEDVPVRLQGLAGLSVKNPSSVTGEVIRLTSEKQMEEARLSCQGEKQTVAVNAVLTARVGQPISLSLTDGERTIECAGQTVEKAAKGRLDEARIREQLSKTGGTPYRMDTIELAADEDAFVPVSAVNALRRSCLESLSFQRIKQKRGATGEIHPYRDDPLPDENPDRPRLAVQSADCALLRRLERAGADDLVYFPADTRAEALGKADMDGMYLYLPPVMHTDTLKELNRLALDRAESLKGVYITNVGQMDLTWPGEKRFSFELNLANEPALRFLGAERSIYTPSVELTCREIASIGGRRELAVYGRLPLMHLRHCPLNAARGGGQHVSCRACDLNPPDKRLDACSLTDRMKAVFPLRRLASDRGCVIDLLNSVPLDVASRTVELPKSAVWRLLFTDETPAQAEQTLLLYARLARGEEAAVPDRPHTTGHYFRKTE
ncbi:MAG: U32 family peptidase [Clostridia bacterium]|nr:U32 family peptidase [Clostridia bacterium]